MGSDVKIRGAGSILIPILILIKYITAIIVSVVAVVVQVVVVDCAGLYR